MMQAAASGDASHTKTPSVILVVEDSPKVRLLTSRILQAAGFSVREAATGAEALRSAAEQPDLIVLDIRLPDLDGFEVCRRLKADPTTALIPILYLSGAYKEVADRVRGLELGANGYLTKPFDPAELVATVRALLRLRQTEAALRDVEGRLRQAEKMEAIGRLAGGIAHDFNNLLMIILGRSDVLRESLPPEHPMHRHVKLIQQAADEGAGLTRQLLTFSRHHVIRPQILDVDALVHTMASILRRLLGEPIELVTRLGAVIPTVKADATQLEQVILNLAVNARDAMPNGGQLLIETETTRHAGVDAQPYIRLTVRDTGVGMDSATRARIFEPFFTTKAPGKGTGLGLATVYGIVQQSGGDIRVESAPGRGTRFTVELPCTESPRGSEGRHRDVTPYPEGSESVLLVEDEERVRALAREMLEAHGYHVLDTATPREALRIGLQATDRIHLLLTDVVMNEMSGHELAQQLVAVRPHIKTLYMSGYTADVVLHQGVSSSEPGFLAKPFTKGVLLRKVREILDRPHFPQVGEAISAPTHQ